MEMAMEQVSAEEAVAQQMQGMMERLQAAAGLLERAVESLGGRPVATLSAEAEASIERIVATAEAKREAELERKLEFVEAQLEALRSAGSQARQAAGMQAGAEEVRTGVEARPSGRVTVGPATATLLAKQGVSVDALEAQGAEEHGGAGLDRALRSLSIEQRIAVKAELLRAGALR